RNRLMNVPLSLRTSWGPGPRQPPVDVRRPRLPFNRRAPPRGCADVSRKNVAPFPSPSPWLQVPPGKLNPCPGQPAPAGRRRVRRSLPMRNRVTGMLALGAAAVLAAAAASQPPDRGPGGGRKDGSPDGPPRGGPPGRFEAGRLLPPPLRDELD